MAAMIEFYVAQLDYVYFVYGLAMVALGAVAAVQPRSESGRLPWEWLSAFAFLYGIVAWIQLVQTALGGQLVPASVTSLLSLASYLLLLEFARRARAVTHGSGPAPWVTGAVALLPLLVASVWGVSSLGTAVRLLAALPATLGAALVIGAASGGGARPDGEVGQELFWTAVGLSIFGVASGIFVPASPVVPTGWPTEEAFLAVTGIPIQVVRVLGIGVATVGVWAHGISLDPNGRVAKKRRRFFWALNAALFAILAGGWVFTERLGSQRDRELQADAQAGAASVQDHLAMELSGTVDSLRTLQRVVAAFDLSPALALGDKARLHDLLDAVAGENGDPASSLIDTGGRVVASSLRGGPEDNLEARVADGPWFRAAVEGRDVHTIGARGSGGTPVFLAAGPVRDGSGAILGVAVVEQVIDRDSFGPRGTGVSLLVSDDGRVILAGEGWDRGRVVWAGAAQPAGVVGGESPLMPGPWSGAAWVRLDRQRQVAVRSPLPWMGASVVSLRAETLTGMSRLLGIAITLILSIGVISIFVLLQAQFGTEAQLTQKRNEAEGRARAMARKADTDALTGIANRQSFNEAMAREFARAHRFRHPLSVVIVDLDHFKDVNDRFGHAAGDQVLSATARLLAARVRDSDLVARWGGEEFAIIASMTDAAGAARLAEKLRTHLEGAQIGSVGRVTASFGVAEMRPEDSLHTMIHRADDALYAAKNGGRNQVQCAESWVDMGAVQNAEKDTSDGKPCNPSGFMETGYGPFDAEHRELAEGIADFIERVDLGDAENVRPGLVVFIATVVDHFGLEEELMRKSAYPSRTRHEEAHAHFVADSRRFLLELEQNGVTLGFRHWATKRLPEWFRYHILSHDVALGKHLRAPPEG